LWLLLLWLLLLLLLLLWVLLLLRLLLLDLNLLLDERLLLLWGVLMMGQVHIATKGSNSSLSLKLCLQSVHLCNLLRC
jgi:hypothetical protein